MFRCLICNQIFESSMKFARHIVYKEKLKVKEYYDRYLKKDGDGVCKNTQCKKQTRFGNYKGTFCYQLYCCRKCCSSDSNFQINRGKSLHIALGREETIKKKRDNTTRLWKEQEYRNKTISGMSISYKNNLQRIEETRQRMLNLWKDDKFRNIVKESTTKLVSTVEWKNRQSKLSKKLWKNQEYKSKHSKSSSKYMLAGGAIKALKGNSWISKPQRVLFELVKLIYPEARLNYPLKECNVLLDIAIEDLKLCIEYDGKYWHQDKEKDRIRDEKLKQMDWKVIRFEEHIPDEKELRMKVTEVLNA